MRTIIKESMSYFTNVGIGEITFEWMHADFSSIQDASSKERFLIP